MLSGIVKLLRGAGEHLAALSDAELRVFIILLLNADSTGQNRGVFVGTQLDLARLAGGSTSRVNRAVRDLIKRRWIAKVPRVGFEILGYDGDEDGAPEAAPKKVEESRQRDIQTPQKIPPAGYLEREKGERKSRQRDISDAKKSRQRDIRGSQKSRQRDLPPSSGIATPLLSIEEEKKIRTPPLPPPAGGELVGGEHAKAFDLWYGVYPRKVAKQDARKAFLGVIRTADDWRLLLANSKAWIESDFAERSTDKIPYPATFLRRGDWQEPPPERRGGSTRLRNAVDELRDL